MKLFFSPWNTHYIFFRICVSVFFSYTECRLHIKGHVRFITVPFIRKIYEAISILFSFKIDFFYKSDLRSADLRLRMKITEFKTF